MWVRKRIDIGWRDILSIFARCCFSWRSIAERVEFDGFWGDGRAIIPVYSVRSGFDLFLRSVNLPDGSEVLMSAYTIPDMPRIVEHHGLIPVPMDLSAHEMGIDNTLLERSITPKTRVLVVAHLFGIRLNLDKVIAVARKHGLIVIEDCAQIFRGKNFSGHFEADMTMFSFGAIKTATALGGGLLFVQDAELAERIKSRQDDYPRQSRISYLTKTVKYALLKIISCRPWFGMLVVILRFFKFDYDQILNRLSRGFPGDHFFEKLRRKPNLALLQTMRRRIYSFDEVLLQHQIDRGDHLAEKLKEFVRSPGMISGKHCYWVFPILSQNPQQLISVLSKNGFDATQGESMKVIKVPAGHPQVEPKFAIRLHQEIVYLPFYREIPDSELERMSEIINRSDS